MILDLKQRIALLEGTLVLDFIEIQLTQKKSIAPRVYNGPGSIETDGDGQLALKMFHKYKDKSDPRPDLEHIFANKAPLGQIIAEEHYYSLSAIDLSGAVWTADSLRVQGSIANSSGNVIRSIIRELKTENSHHFSETTLAAWIPGKYQIPTNEITETPTSTTRNVFAENNKLFSCRCVDKEKFLEVSVNFSETHEALNSETFLEGLSLGLGKVVFPVYMITTKNRKLVTSVFSRSKTLGLEIGAPFQNQLPDQVKELAKFLQAYISKFNSTGNDLYCYWHRVLRSTNDGLENRALVLSICIEGIVTQFFNQHGIPEDIVIEETDRALRALKRLKNCNSHFKIREKIINCLAHTKKSTAKQALNKLENLRILEPNMAQTWSIIRNKSAHPHQLDSDQSTTQEYVNQYYICLAIFYRLLFQYIGYSGYHINYAKLDFPQEVFSGRETI